MITTENIFNSINLIVLLGWIPLFIFPYSRFTRKLVNGLYLPFFLCVFYLYFLSQTEGLFSADFSSIAGILDLFKSSTEESAAAGWIHYLAFDYFVGCWIVNHSIKKGIPYIIFIIPLIFTLFAGPFGLLLFLILRLFYKRLTLKDAKNN
ncbi:MAG: ABA4-like family protein [Flavobacteriaceae bacterium]